MAGISSKTTDTYASSLLLPRLSPSPANTPFFFSSFFFFFFREKAICPYIALLIFSVCPPEKKVNMKSN